MHSRTPTTWLITGCSSGLGRALAEKVLARGDNAVVTARDAAHLRTLTDRYPDSSIAVSLDVTDQSQVVQAVQQATDRFGRIDVLVNNAGYGYRAAVEEGDEVDVARLFDTNVFGPIALIKAVLPGMRAQRVGAIVNISSIAVRLTPAGSGYYAASKAALEAVTGSLGRELQPLGISVMAVEPGAFRTEFSGRSLGQSTAVIDDYSATAGMRRKEKDTSHGTEPGDPHKGAEAIIRAVEAPDTPKLLLLGTDSLSYFQAAATTQQAEIDTWKSTSRSTDF